MAWFMPEIRLIGNVTIAVVLIYGSYLAFDGQVTVAFSPPSCSTCASSSTMQEISQFYTFQSASAALEKLSGVLEEEPDVLADAPVPLPQSRGELTFDNVRFEYRDQLGYAAAARRARRSDLALAGTTRPQDDARRATHPPT